MDLDASVQVLCNSNNNVNVSFSEFVYRSISMLPKFSIMFDLVQSLYVWLDQSECHSAQLTLNGMFTLHQFGIATFWYGTWHWFYWYCQQLLNVIHSRTPDSQTFYGYDLHEGNLNCNKLLSLNFEFANKIPYYISPIHRWYLRLDEY